MTKMTTAAHREIQRILDNAVRQGDERGIQVAVYHHGRLVVDAWAGMADPATGRAVAGDTLFPVFSTSKGVTATLIHLLAERGLIAYDQPVCAYWPDFAAAGKERITIRQVLAHTSGVPQMPEGIAADDWHGLCSAIARMPPAFPPGAMVYYHALSYGHILGEVARLVTGREFAELIEELLCKPLGTMDLYFGLPPECASRVAVLEAPETGPVLPDPSGIQTVPLAWQPLHVWMNQAAGRRACVPGGGGIMSARAVARMYAALLPGGVAGVELLPPERIRLATMDQVTNDGIGTGRGLGYILGGANAKFGPRGTAFGHDGHGGSAGFADPELGLAVGLAKNRFSSRGVENRVFDCLRELFG